MLILLLTACGSSAPAPSEIDEIGFTVAVQARRPDLFREDCWNTLTLAPSLRDGLLAGTDSYASIVARDYVPDERAADLAWIRSNQAAELAFCQAHPGTWGCTRICSAACDACNPPPTHGDPRESLAIEPSGYPLCAAVGYRIGQWSSSHLYDPAGRVRSWKVFFSSSGTGAFRINSTRRPRRPE